MPIYKKCPLCNKEVNHGFDITNGGFYFYHKHNNQWNSPYCSYYVGDDNNIYKTELELFENVVIPRTPKNKTNNLWISARLADLNNHPRLAKKLYKQWNDSAYY